MEKNKVIDFAKQAGLVFNTELMQEELHRWHRKALYDFAELIEEYIQQVLVSRLDEGSDEYEKVKADILRSI